MRPETCHATTIRRGIHASLRPSNFGEIMKAVSSAGWRLRIYPVFHGGFLFLPP